MEKAETTTNDYDDGINKADPQGIKFREWVKTLPKNHWAQYDLAACRLGWDAATKLAEKEARRNWEEYFS